MFYIKKYYNYLLRKTLDLYINFFKKSFENVTLDEVLNYCSTNILFYRNSDNDVKNNKFINSQTVKNHFPEFIKKGILIQNTGFTSGTTGVPQKFLRDLHSMAAEQYFQSKYFKWENKFKVIFRGEQLFTPYEKPKKIFKIIPFLKEMYISSYHINDENLKQVVKQLKKINNKCFWAYPSSAYLLAEYCLRNKEEIDFDIVATSSEMIFEYQIAAIEKAFKCKVKDWYGQAERVSALYRCNEGHYHEVNNYSHVEYLPIGENLYEIVGTTLHNELMPLVRYKTDDIVELSETKCKCGDDGVNIVNITGRRSNCIELNGVKIPECLFSCLMKKTENICQFQVVQNKYGKINYRVVRNKFFNNDNEKNLLKTIYNVLPKELCTVEYVDVIEKDKNGKLRCVITENINEMFL